MKLKPESKKMSHSQREKILRRPEMKKCTVDVHTCSNDRVLPIRVITLLREEVGGVIGSLEVVDR